MISQWLVETSYSQWQWEFDILVVSDVRLYTE